MKAVSDVRFREMWSQVYSVGGGPVTVLISQRIASVFAWLFLRSRISPNVVTVAGGFISVVGSVLYVILPGGLVYAVTCLIVYQLSYCFDCADGQLARATGKSSEFGAWLDIAIDIATQLLQAFALLFWLAVLTDGLHVQAFVAVAFLAIGRTLAVFTGKHTSQHRMEKKPGGQLGKAKWLAWLALDTPVLLLCISMMRDFHLMLTWYLFLIGVAYVLNGIYLAYWRLYFLNNSAS